MRAVAVVKHFQGLEQARTCRGLHKFRDTPAPSSARRRTIPPASCPNGSFPFPAHAERNALFGQPLLKVTVGIPHGTIQAGQQPRAEDLSRDHGRLEYQQHTRLSIRSERLSPHFRNVTLLPRVPPRFSQIHASEPGRSEAAHAAKITSRTDAATKSSSRSARPAPLETITRAST